LNKPQEITTRFAGPADAGLVHGALLELAASMNKSHRIGSTIADITAALSRVPPDIHAIIAQGKNNNETVGLGVFFLIFSTWRGTRGVYLQDIFVADSMRGTGLGARLLREVISWGVDQGADHLRLSVDRRNKKARSFYESLGLSLRENERIYTIAGDACVELGADS
jgi:GNAT superfamily N-acetyltransferase